MRETTSHTHTRVKVEETPYFGEMHSHRGENSMHPPSPPHGNRTNSLALIEYDPKKEDHRGDCMVTRGGCRGEYNIHGNWRGPDRHRRDLIG